MWQPIETAPQDESTFLAGVLVHNNLTKKDHWEYALMFFDEGRFRFFNDADTGWEPDDYTHWQAITPPVQPQQ